MSSLAVTPSQGFQGEIEVPGDKSISHRAVIFGSIAEGETTVENLLEGEDVLCTISIFKALGVRIRKKNNRWTIQGRGLSSLRGSKKVLYCGNSGTTLRLLTGLLSGLHFTSRMTGDDSLNNRPMGRILEPLRKMGALIKEEGKRRVIVIQGVIRESRLKGLKFKSPVASAQLKSALLLAGLSASKPVTVQEPSRSRDHSERMLKSFGADLRVQGSVVTLQPGRPLRGRSVLVPGDISSAAFFIVLGLISPNPSTLIRIRNVGLNPTRTGILDVLKKMGAKISIQKRRTLCGEPVGDLLIRPSRLKAVTISGYLIPRLVDEIPILCIAAACAHGKTVIRDAQELRIKETDRIHALATELPKFGVRIKERRDGLDIIGPTNIRPAVGNSHGDHRMAMSLAVLASLADGRSRIRDSDCIQTSFPSFEKLFKAVGGRIVLTNQ